MKQRCAEFGEMVSGATVGEFGTSVNNLMQFHLYIVMCMHSFFGYALPVAHNLVSNGLPLVMLANFTCTRCKLFSLLSPRNGDGLFR